MSKERLTYHGTPQMTEDRMITPAYSDYQTRDIIHKLAEYEDLEEQGLLLRLPCKVGDIVYSIMKVRDCSVDNCITEASCEECEFYDQLYVLGQKNFSVDRDLKEIGKTVFLTKSEAEEKLRELEGK